MSGVTLKVEALGIEEVERRLRALVAAGHDMTPAMNNIGEYLVRATRDRFDDEEGPDGTPWKPLSETTKARKRRNAGKILTLEGYLRVPVYRPTPTSVEVGSPLIYAGTHQFGAEKGSFGSTGKGASIPFGDIPARPFLGLSDADRDELTDILRDYIMERLERIGADYTTVHPIWIEVIPPKTPLRFLVPAW